MYTDYDQRRIEWKRDVYQFFIPSINVNSPQRPYLKCEANPLGPNPCNKMSLKSSLVPVIIQYIGKSLRLTGNLFK